jgi:NADPH-dependent 7-cyano-7-deazaguanine reductase QueF-like protein
MKSLFTKKLIKSNIFQYYLLARRRIRFRAVDEYDRICYKKSFSRNFKENEISLPFEGIFFHNEELYHVYEIDLNLHQL